MIWLSTAILSVAYRGSRICKDSFKHSWKKNPAEMAKSGRRTGLYAGRAVLPGDKGCTTGGRAGGGAGAGTAAGAGAGAAGGFAAGGGSGARTGILDATSFCFALALATSLRTCAPCSSQS